MNESWRRLRPLVLRRIKPRAVETKRAQKAARTIAAAATKEARRLGQPGRALVVGSLAKDTHLRRPDIDVFILFPPTLERAELERLGLAIGRAVLSRAQLKYAEHPYVRGRHGGFVFDLVPAYEVADASQRMSAVDRSPFHLEYVRRHLKRSQRDEVRLLKQFLQGIGCYGAETATGGFSGYLAELLVLRFGSFWDCLVSLREQRAPIELALAPDAPPLGGALVFVDPVDPRRNAAAAVSAERLETFLRASRAFTAAPSKDFFWPRPVKPLPRKDLALLLGHRGVVGVELPSPTTRPDARLPHLRRFAEKVSRHLAEEGFRVLRHAVEPVGTRRFLCLWEHEPVELPEEYEHRGPREKDASHVARFLEKWRSHPDRLDAPRIVEGRYRVRVKRRIRTGPEVLAKALPRLLVGVDVAAASRSRVRAAPALELAAKPGLAAPLSRFLAPRDPWQSS